MLLIAQLQSDQIGDTWKEAHARRRRNGLPHTSFPRFGYQYDRAERLYKVDEVEGPILADLYHRYLAGQSQKALSNWLNDEGIKTKRGCNWNASSLMTMMENGFAAGYYGVGFQESGSYEEWLRGSHAPVIAEDVWQAFLSRRNSRVRARRSNAGK